jgi:large repetitive protein
LTAEGTNTTSWTPSTAPSTGSGQGSGQALLEFQENSIYYWRARAYDGDRYGAWMDMASFSIHLPSTNITATIDFDPNTLNKKSKGNWVTVYIELPAGYSVTNINISSLLLNNSVHAETWPYAVGDNDRDGIPDLMVKFNRDAVINILPNGDNIQVKVTGTVGTTTFEGVDRIRVIK